MGGISGLTCPREVSRVHKLVVQFQALAPVLGLISGQLDRGILIGDMDAPHRGR
jgi:hypothetical protein